MPAGRARPLPSPRLARQRRQSPRRSASTGASYSSLSAQDRLDGPTLLEHHRSFEPVSSVAEFTGCTATYDVEAVRRDAACPPDEDDPVVESIELVNTYLSHGMAAVPEEQVVISSITRIAQ